MPLQFLLPVCFKCFREYYPLSLYKSQRERTYVNHVLKMKRLRHREVKKFTQGLTAGK